MRYKLYTTSHEAWDAMLAAIESAQKSIYMEMYIFLDDTQESHDFIGKLVGKAKNGLRVVLVADAFGSKEISRETIVLLKESGVEFLFFSHWLRHIHRKLLIVDEQIAFMGGVNIGKRFTHWNDLQMKLEGIVAKTLLKSFAYTYEMAGGKEQKILDYKNKKIASRVKYLLIEHWPIKNIFSLKKHYVENVTKARKSIKIVTPYFTPPRWLMSLLDDALRRGVEVDVLVPREADMKIMNDINYHYMRNCPKGIRFHLSHTMVHAKVLMIDEEICLLGSQNVDLASFSINAEIGMFFKNKRLISEVAHTINEWEKESTLFEPMQYKMHFKDYLLLVLSKIFWPIL